MDGVSKTGIQIALISIFTAGAFLISALTIEVIWVRILMFIFADIWRAVAISWSIAITLYEKISEESREEE